MLSSVRVPTNIVIAASTLISSDLRGVGIVIAIKPGSFATLANKSFTDTVYTYMIIRSMKAFTLRYCTLIGPSDHGYDPRSYAFSPHDATHNWSFTAPQQTLQFDYNGTLCAMPNPA